MIVGQKWKHQSHFEWKRRFILPDHDLFLHLRNVALLSPPLLLHPKEKINVERSLKFGHWINLLKNKMLSCKV